MAAGDRLAHAEPEPEATCWTEYLVVGVNLDKPHLWKADVAASVDMYNEWFLKFAPKAFRDSRIDATKNVTEALKLTSNATSLSAAVLMAHPEILPTFRMSTCPPLAVDRLIGLSGASGNLVKNIDTRMRLPPRMARALVATELAKVASVLQKMIDPDIFTWLSPPVTPTAAEVERAATIVADRLCGSVANPIIRNAQEKRQLAAIEAWLRARGYRPWLPRPGVAPLALPPGTFSFRTNVPVDQGGGRFVNIPIDAVVKSIHSAPADLPLLIEAKSAGDFTNTNKRRKEEAVKMQQLRSTYGADIGFILFLCGYFDSGYLGYEAAEGIDWVWEHRIDDLELFGL